MKTITAILIPLILGLSSTAALAEEPVWLELEPARIRQTAKMLPEQPAGLGRPISDRSFWSDPAVIVRTQAKATRAKSLLSKEFPAWDDATYLEFSRNGERKNGQDMQNRRGDWLMPLVLAECLENNGTYLPLLNKILTAYTEEPTWTMAAHDRNLKNFHREQYDVDLRTAGFGLELAQTLWLLGDKLDPAVQSRVRNSLEQRLLEPFRRRLHTGSGCWWLGDKQHPVQNNWNPVCLSGVVGTALTLLPDKSERAVFIAASEYYSRYYLNSYKEDGYCEEGTGYWNYALSNYVVLREFVAQATKGGVELLADKKLLDIFLFGLRIPIGGNIAPPFGDCRANTKAGITLPSYCNTVLHLGLPMESFPAGGFNGRIVECLLVPTPLSTSTMKTSASLDPLRHFFASSGVLSCRPAPDANCRLGVGLKAGGNGSHSHNDIGSYAIVLGSTLIAGDPGGPLMYNGKTFGPERYTYKMLNSYGHPLPVIAGQLQIDAVQAHPKVLNTDFSPDQDSMSIDLTTAYAVPALQKLVRTLRYCRIGSGELVITDDVDFLQATQFHEALVTYGEWRQIDARTLEISLSGEQMRVTVDTPDGFTVKAEKIQELGSSTFIRLGLELNKPLTKSRLRMTFTSVPKSQ